MGPIEEEYELNHTMPEIVVFPSLEDLSKLIVKRARRRSKPNFDFSNAVDLSLKDRVAFTNKWGLWHYLTDIDRFLIKAGLHAPVFNCINTASSIANPFSNETIAKNSSLYLNPGKYGYTRIKPEYSLPGDVILWHSEGDKYPHHAGIVTKVGNDGVWGISSEGSSIMHPEKLWSNDFRKTLENDKQTKFLYYRKIPKYHGSYINDNDILLRPDEYVRKHPNE